MKKRELFRSSRFGGEKELSRDYATAAVAIGRTSRMIRSTSVAEFRRSHSVWMLSQKRGDWPK